MTVQDLQASYLSEKQGIYEFHIDLLMAMRRNPSPEAAARFEAAALEANERRLARSLLDSLIEARADIRQGVDQGCSPKSAFSDSASTPKRSIGLNCSAASTHRSRRRRRKTR